MSIRQTVSALALITLSWPGLAAAQALPTFRVTELTSPAGASCAATALNDAGVVAGSCEIGSGLVVWRNGQPTKVGLLAGGTYANPTAINTLGVVVGDADANFSPRTQAFVSAATGVANIDPNNGGNSRSIGIMDNGVIFGDMTKSLSGNTSSWDVVMWTPDSGHAGRYKSTLLPHYPGGVSKFNGVFGTQANKVGQVAGWVTTSIIGQLGALWNNDAAHTVVTLPPLAGGNHSIAWALNDLGQAAGESNTLTTAEEAVLWQNDAAHTVIGLGILPGETESLALGVNNAAQIIGLSGQRAFFYQNGTMADLSSLVDPLDGFWSINGVFAINNAGQILAMGTQNGRQAAILLTPIQ
jgi:probable HAF family extracellular repeat protein